MIMIMISKQKLSLGLLLPTPYAPNVMAAVVHSVVISKSKQDRSIVIIEHY